MKRMFLFSVLMLAASVLCAAVPGQQFVTPEGLHDLMLASCNGGSELVIIDLRMGTDYSRRHIFGAVNADMTAAVNGNDQNGIEALKKVLLESTGSDTGSGKLIILACYTGNVYAAKATRLLTSMGADMSTVYTLQGGNSAWDQSPYASLVDTAEPVNDGLKAGGYLDFSGYVANSGLDIYSALDIISVTTPCAFESLAYEGGFVAGYEGTDYLLLDEGSGDVVRRHKDGSMEIAYANGVRALAETGWPAGSALASYIPQPADSKVYAYFGAFCDDALIVYFGRFSDSYALSYVRDLASAFPVAGKTVTQAGKTSYQGMNLEGVRCTFLHEGTYTAVMVTR